MIEEREPKKKLVIPKWLSYEESARRHEQAVPNRKPIVINSETQKAIIKDIKAFEQSGNIHDATDLMSGAYITGDEKLAKQMAKIVSKNNKVSNVAKRLALSILGINTESMPVINGREHIHYLKKYLADYPRDGIAWVQLARLYTLEGLPLQASRCIDTACYLYPANRYVVRCAARFYFHIRDFKKAYYYAHKACNIMYDPWLKATEINLALETGAPLSSRRKIISTIPTDQQALFHLSELFESVGMIELENGNDKKAKKYFKTAWEFPSSNVLSHGEWILRKQLPGFKGDFNLDIRNSPEALYWNTFTAGKYDEALKALVNWELEEPYSTHPYIGASALCSSLEKYDKAIAFAERGLIVNPHSFIIANNLVYSLLKKGEITHASKRFEELHCPDDPNSRVVYGATNGLLEFKKGNIEKGKELYIKSIELAQKNKKYSLGLKAILNLLMAELEADLCDEKLINKALAVSEKHAAPDIKLARAKLNKLYKRPLKKYNETSNNILLKHSY